MEPDPRPPSAFPLPSVTVDVVAWAVLEADLKLLLVRRKAPPFKDAWALPGGFVRIGTTAEDQGEDLPAAAERELLEETALRPGAFRLRALRAFGAAGRDPRTRVITVAYWTAVRPELAAYVRAGSDASDAQWMSFSDVAPPPAGTSGGVASVELAFDHAQILAFAYPRLVESVEDGEADQELVAEPFSLAELRAVHEAVVGRKLDPGNFRRQFLRRVDEGEAEEVPGERVTGRRRGAVYRWRR